MKTLFSLILALSTIGAWAVDYPDHLRGNGRAAFVWKNEFSSRRVDLFLPYNPKTHKVFVAFDGVDDQLVEATAAWVRKEGEREVLHVILPSIPGGEPNTEVYLQGTMLRANNAARYQGDFYYHKKTTPKPVCVGTKKRSHIEYLQECTPWVHGGLFQVNYAWD